MYYIIINPASRSGKGLKLWKEIVEPELQRARLTYRSYYSREAGDVKQLAKEITSIPRSEWGESTHRSVSGITQKTERQKLIILGGDGTMNEALQGIRDLSQVEIGYIPTGSSNDLARDLGIPKDPVEALDHILYSGKVHTMDIGKVTYHDGTVRYFNVSCGVGFDAAVCEETLHSGIKAFCNKIGLGKLTYMGIALKLLIAAKKVSCEVTLDDHKPFHLDKLLFIASMNHRYEGGGFKFCPTANPCDGILDLCVVGDVPKLLVLCALPTAFVGKHFMFRGVTPYRARKIRITTSQPLCIHTDGEPLKRTTDFTVICQQNAIHMVF